MTDKKQDPNFEKAYTQIVEFKSDTMKSFASTINFIQSYLDSTFQSSSNELDNFINAIETNKGIIKDNINNFRSFLIKQYTERVEKLSSLQKMYEELNDKAKKIYTGKQRYKECNLMQKNEVLSIRFQIASLSHQIKAIQNETLGLENDIAKLKKENKDSYSKEISLLGQVMSFDKKLYNVYNEREEKTKIKERLEAEFNAKKAEKIRRIEEENKNKLDVIRAQLEGTEREKATLKNEYESLTKHTQGLSEIVALLKEKAKKMMQSKIEEVGNTSMIEELNSKYKAEISQLIENAIKDFSFLNLHMKDINLSAITSQLTDYYNDNTEIDSIKADIVKSEEELSKLENELEAKIHHKKLISISFSILKKNYKTNKKKRQIEEERQNKLKRLKEKEAQLMKELEQQAEKQASMLEAQQLAQLKTDIKKTKNNKKFKRSKGASLAGTQDYSSFINDLIFPIK